MGKQGLMESTIPIGNQRFPSVENREISFYKKTILLTLAFFSALLMQGCTSYFPVQPPITDGIPDTDSKPPQVCVCDLNGDGVVDMTELAAVVAFKFNLKDGVKPDLTTVDLNKDGKVDDYELSYCFANEVASRKGRCEHKI